MAGIENLRKPQRFNDTVAGLLDADRLNALGPGEPNLGLQSRLDTLSPLDLFEGSSIVDDEMAECCLSGIWLFHDFLDESHRLSQEVHSATGSYWHGIMHRREQDFSNAKYWFRKVGNHPVFEKLATATAARLALMGDSSPGADLVANGAWDPYAFVDLCQHCRRAAEELSQFCREAAQDEWWLLFDFCYQAALGKQPS